MDERSRAQKKVGIFEPSTPSKNPPDDSMSRIEAGRLVKDGKALWINHGKAIRLFRPSKETPKTEETPERKVYSRRDRSCKPGPELIERFTEDSFAGKVGSASAIMAAAWPGKVVA